MTTYGYARSIPWQGRRNRHPAESAVHLSGAGVAAAHILQDIITGTVMQRPGLNAVRLEMS